MDLASRWMEQVANSAASTVVFLDWDDKEIARVKVPRELKGEARLAYLNAYVRDNLIHPDLRRANLSSLKRKDTYRGKYAYDPEKRGNPAYIRKDGENFPLTNKLDYKFVTGKQMPQPDGTIRIEDDPNDPYPYLRGFITVINTADSPWTTFGGAGELSKYRHEFPDGRVRYIHTGPLKWSYPYEVFPDGRVVFYNNIGGIARTGTIDDATPMMLSSYDEAVQPMSLEDDDPTETSAVPAASDDDELIEIPDDELENLYALRDGWQAAHDLEAAFVAEMGAESLEAAVRRASSERLRSVIYEVLSATGSGFGGQAVREMPDELARRVIEIEKRVGAVDAPSEEV